MYDTDDKTQKKNPRSLIALRSKALSPSRFSILSFNLAANLNE